MTQLMKKYGKIPDLISYRVVHTITEIFITSCTTDIGRCG